MTDVHTDGAAYKDGRIRKGDVILAVNDISFRDVPSRDAIRVLKEASSPLKLMILRENPQTLFTTSQSKHRNASDAIRAYTLARILLERTFPRPPKSASN